MGRSGTFVKGSWRNGAIGIAVGDTPGTLPPMATDALLDAGDEVWSFDPKNQLEISSGGKVAKAKKTHGILVAVESRHTLYRLVGSLYVDVEVRGPEAVLRRGVLNGRDVTIVIPAVEVGTTLAHYRKLGFRDGTAWHATKTRVTLRDYRKGTAQWTVHVDGTFAFENWRTPTKAASRDAAIALAEKKIAAKERAGYTLHLIELKDAEHPNPEPKLPKSTPSKPLFGKRPAFPKPATAHGAVDSAIAMLRDLHTRLDRFHFIAECIDPNSANDRARLEHVESNAAFFLEQHAARMTRWKTARPNTPKLGESSWSYFLRTYGSITWILDTQIDRGLDMFYCGNVTGGGWSCLEVAEDIYDIDGLSDAIGNPGLEVLDVFHGGWHDGKSFAFDTRTRGRTGDAAIIPFGDDLLELPPAPRANTVKPFGDWLLARVLTQTKIVEKNIRELS